MVCRCAIEGGTNILWCILADGEMSALAWLPPIIAMILIAAIKPTPMPPEQARYIPKKQRHNTEKSGAWFWKNTPTWMAGMSDSGVHTLTSIGARKVSFSYDKYSWKERRRSGRQVNRKLAISMRLVTITCMAASTQTRSQLRSTIAPHDA
jgi:hypothetical protein